jgi:hypothetical protein
MKYQVSNQVTKQGQKGDYISCTLTNENGEVFDKINLFNGEATGKTEIEGDLIQNGQYWNFKAKVTYTAGIPARGAGIAQAQIRKQEGIEHSQDRKEAGIANSGSIGNATLLVTSMINAGIIPSTSSEGDIMDAVLRYAKWYRVQYNNPSNIDDIPF